LEFKKETLRFIFLTRQLCNITTAIRSRCLALRNPLKMQKCKLKDDENVLEIYKMVISYKNIKDLTIIRKYLYTLVPHNVNITKIFQGLLDLLLRTNISKKSKLFVKEKKIKRKFIKYASKYEHCMKNGNNDIFHLEAFIFNVLKILY
jgi:hypothetical protein